MTQIFLFTFSLSSLLLLYVLVRSTIIFYTAPVCNSSAQWRRFATRRGEVNKEKARQCCRAN
jgi:hypothetical protein